MAKQSGLAQKFFLGGFDISGDVGSIRRCSTPVQMFDVTGIDKLAKERIEGVVDATFEFDAFVNTTATTGSHAVLSSLPTTDRTGLYLLGNGGGTIAIGDVAAGIVATQVDYQVDRPADGSLAVSVNLTSSGGGGIEWGQNLVAAGKTTHASATSESSLDGTAGTSAGGVGYLQHVSRASGTVTYLIEHSTNNSTWATLLTFATSGGASAAAERKTVSGTVNRYIRATTNGTFADAVFAMAFRRGLTSDRVAYT